MTKRSSSFQGNIMRATLICFFIVLRFCSTRNVFYELDLSAQTLNPVATGFMITGNAVGDYFGGSVSTAGDIDNDGYDDIIVASSEKNSQLGAVYVIYGRQELSFLDIDLSTSLDPLTTGFTITGNAAGDRFGISVSTAGDINKDGFDDIIIGADKKNSKQGAAYVIYGGDRSTRSNIVLSSTTLDPLTTGFTITGNAANDLFGNKVSTAGDINKDGYDDIIVGAWGKSTAQGAVYVIYGGDKSSMSNIVLSSTALNPLTTGFMITGNTAGDYFGNSLSTAGDINKDGYDDIVIGAGAKNAFQGTVYVIYGGEKATMSNIVLSSTTLNPLTTGFMITGNAAGGRFGYAVSTAGDINKDGYDDIMVGAYVQGVTYVIYGGDKSSMSNFVVSSTTLVPASTGFIITGTDYFGWSLSTAGDINKDGYDDIMIGAYAKNSNQGIAYVIYGGDKSSQYNFVVSSTVLDPLTKGFTITGNAAGDYFGAAVSTAGDINKDGYPDIIVGAYGKNSNKGAAYVIYDSCSANCKQCSSESVCTQCKSSYFMYQSKCFASCPDGTIATSATTCGDCPVHCKHCTSTTVCTECKTPYILYLSQCLDSCPDGMFLGMTTCENCVSPCSKCTSLSACTECISSYALYGSQCLTSCPMTMFNSNNFCKNCSSYCYSCASQDSCQACFEGFTLSNSLCVFNSPSDSSSQGAQEKASQAIASATQAIGSVICVGSAAFPLSALVSKIVQNTRYLNLSVTGELTGVYQTWQTNIISWDVPNVMSDLDHFKTSPPLFAQYDLGSPFLVNFWPTLINVSIGFGTFISCILIQKLFESAKYEGWAYSLVRKLVAGSFNFALVQAYACLDDILFYLVLDAKTNPFNSFFSWASIISAAIFLGLGCLQVFFNFWTVTKYQSIKKQGAKDLIESFNERNKYWELFYSDFNDDDLWSQSFFAILIMRSSLSSFMITILYDYPLMQTVYLVILDGAVILFLYFKNPFNTLRGTLAQYYYEIITLFVHLCAFILALQDSFKYSSDTVRLIMSTGILYLNTALISGAIGFMFIEIYKTISEKKRAARLKKRQTVPEDSQETQNLTREVSPFHPPEADAPKRQYWINTEQTDSIENFHLEPANHQSRNLATSDFHMESSQGLETDSYVENSISSDMNASNTINPQRNQSPMQIMIRHRPQNRNQRRQRNNPRDPNYIINFD